jgi:hypothetical protein
MRLGQTPLGIEDACGGEHAGPSAGPACDLADEQDRAQVECL